MITLSTGQPSTLGSYLKLCQLFFGDESVQAKFIHEKIASNPNGPDEEVVVEESQMMYLLVNLPPAGTNVMKDLLS